MYRILDVEGNFTDKSYVTPDLCHYEARDKSKKDNTYYTVVHLKNDYVNIYLACYHNGMKIEESNKGIG